MWFAREGAKVVIADLLEDEGTRLAAAITRLVAPLLWDQETQMWRRLLLLITFAALCLYAVRWFPLCVNAVDWLNRWCGRFLRSHGR